MNKYYCKQCGWEGYLEPDKAICKGCNSKLYLIKLEEEENETKVS